MSNLANGRIIIKFNNSLLVQTIFPSSHSNFILSLYRVYELNNQPYNPTNDFLLKYFLFGTVKLVSNAIKRKFIHNGQGIVFDGEDSWIFRNDFARNVVIFGVDNSSLFHTDNQKIKLI